MNTPTGVLLEVFSCAALIAVALTSALVLKSAKDYSHGGPQLTDVIKRHFKAYIAYSIVRLGAAIWAIVFLLALPGIAVVLNLSITTGYPVGRPACLVGGLISVVVCIFYQFCSSLLFEPGTLASNSNYRISRFYPLWSLLNPARLKIALAIAGTAYVLLLGFATVSGARGPVSGSLLAPWVLTIVFFGFGIASRMRFVTRPRVIDGGKRKQPNILMIGCDTLRADRVVPGEYERTLAPNIQELVGVGALFANCYVPIARTAPSLTSILTGVWPHRHRVRDNFVSPADIPQDISALPEILKAEGYRTAAIGDWAGSDLGKFPFGFDETDLPEDQWNIKYLIRQGPKDLRLFLSLFTHNTLAKKLLPELYYVAGRPLTGDIGSTMIDCIDSALEDGKPFFINAFMATAHPPFSVEYPYYTDYSDPGYRGASKFAMSKLTDPMEIIRSQREPREAFDLDQIINLYDACVRRFDAEVGRMLNYLDYRNARENTIVVVYSDHGMEFFEHHTWGQGNSALGDYSARIPLVFSVPGSAAPGKITDVVRSIDIAPTLLDLAGVEIPPAMDGCSLKSAIMTGAKPPELTAYFETGIWIAKQPNTHPDHLDYPELLDILDVPDPASGLLAVGMGYQDVVIRARDRLVREGDWALMYQPYVDGARFNLFNLAEDPACEYDRAAENPQLVANLKKQVMVFLAADGIEIV